MKIDRRILIGSFLLLAILQACAARVPQQDPAVAAPFSQGVLRVTYENTLFRTFEATRGTLLEQEMAITSARRNADRGSIQARMVDGTAVNIDLRSITPAQTEVSIKVGAYGSEEISRGISREIESRLEAIE
jgi:hypothetical protein